MLQKLTIIKQAAMVALCFLCSCGVKKDAGGQVSKDVFTTLAVQQDGKETGNWGYVIFHNEKLMIQQFTVPALQGNMHFAGREDAARVGELVAKKLNHAKHPGVTKQELDSLGIIPLENVIDKK